MRWCSFSQIKLMIFKFLQALDEYFCNGLIELYGQNFRFLLRGAAWLLPLLLPFRPDFAPHWWFMPLLGMLLLIYWLCISASLPFWEICTTDACELMRFISYSYRHSIIFHRQIYIVTIFTQNNGNTSHFHLHFAKIAFHATGFLLLSCLDAIYLQK